MNDQAQPNRIPGAPHREQQNGSDPAGDEYDLSYLDHSEISIDTLHPGQLLGNGSGPVARDSSFQLAHLRRCTQCNGAPDDDLDRSEEYQWPDHCHEGAPGLPEQIRCEKTDHAHADQDYRPVPLGGEVGKQFGMLHKASASGSVA